MATVSISQLDTATQAKVDDLYEVAVVDENSQTGYASRKLTAAQIATLFAQGVQFSGLSTAAKTIIAAINEAAQNGGTEVEANPTGTPTDTLETIGIDGTIYGVGGESEPVSKTATGNPIHIEDAADAPIVSGEVLFEPQQDLHGYDKPWTGGAGKNLLPNTVTTQTSNGITFSVNDDGTIKANGTATADSQITIGRANVSGGSYTFSGGVNTGSVNTYYVRYVARDSSGTAIAIDSSLFIDIYDIETTKTLPNNVAYVDGYIGVKNGITVNNLVFKPMVRLATETDPTFAPYSNICPITGYDDCDVEVTGKNLCPYAKLGATSEEFLLDAGNYTFSFKLLGNAMYSTSNVRIDTNTETICRIFVYGKNPGTVLANQFELTERSIVKIIHININADADGYYEDNIQIERGSTSTTFEPYQSKTYTIDLDGTRYGGKVNPVSGEMVVDKTMVDMGTLTWSYNTSRTYPIFLTGISEKAEGVTSNLTILCSDYSAINTRGIDAFANFDNNGCVCERTGYKQIMIQDSRFTDATSFTTAMSGVQLCYELDTPFTVQLTPEQIRTLEGTNNISTNMTDMSLEYITQDYQPLVKLIERSAGHHYSMQERVIGTWIDGKPLYEKVVDFGALPNATTKDLNHGIANVDNIFITGGYAKNTSSGFVQQLNVPVPSNNQAEMQSQWYFGVTATYIRCFTLTDRTSYDECKVILQYTKTTD